MTQISENFTQEEWEYSNTANRKGIANTMREQDIVYATLFCHLIAEPWREMAGGIPFRFSSLFRSYALNRVLPGASDKSSHMMARAGDKPLGNHKQRYGTLENMYQELIESSLPFDKAIIERNRRGQKWIHVQIARIGNEPRGLKYRAVELANGEMDYSLYT